MKDIKKANVWYVSIENTREQLWEEVDMVARGYDKLMEYVDWMCSFRNWRRTSEKVWGINEEVSGLIVKVA